MIRLKPWQWVVLSTPIIGLIVFFSIATGLQIHRWGINWIWAFFVLILVGWRWLLVKWTKPAFSNVENIIADAQKELEEQKTSTSTVLPELNADTINTIETSLQQIISQAKEDAPIWEDFPAFWQRCQTSVETIAKVYHPEVEYPLLNIYIPQAYGLMRDTVDDMDRWMKQLSPVFNQITVAQGYQGYQLYRKLEPSARKIIKVWNWAQWIVNPAVAAAKLASKPLNNQANQELLINLNQVLKEVALRNLGRQAALLYGGDNLPQDKFEQETVTLPEAKTQTLQEIFAQVEEPEQIEQKPVKILLAGRTGAGKSSLINTLFNSQIAEVNILPNTADIQSYQWEAKTGEALYLYDTPGYEQVDRPEFKEQVIDYSQDTDLILLLNPALDPALQMDLDIIKDLPEGIPIITVITQVDRLRPVREWQPPYNWITGDAPKEKSIRQAVEYREEIFGDYTEDFLPIVTASYGDSPRVAWYDDILALKILDSIEPAKQIRLARFLRNLEARSVAAAQIIEKYTFQMATSQGLTALLKSPILQFLSTLTTGSPRLAFLLAEKIPVEQLPVVIGKLQLAYELFNLLSDDATKKQFDLLSLWTLIVETNGLPEDDAWAFGHALVEFWTKNLDFTQLEKRYRYYLDERKSATEN